MTPSSRDYESVSSVKRTDPIPQAVDLCDVVSLLKSSAPEDRDTIVNVLAAIVRSRPTRASEAIQCLEPLVAAENTDVRRSAVLAISYIGAEHPLALNSAIPALIDQLDDNDPQTRLNAVAALDEATSTSPTAVADALPVLAGLLDDGTAAVRLRTAELLHDLAAEVPERVGSVSTVLERSLAAEFEKAANGEAANDIDTAFADESTVPERTWYDAESEPRQGRFGELLASTIATISQTVPGTIARSVPTMTTVLDTSSSPTVNRWILTALGYVAEDCPDTATTIIPAVAQLLERHDDPEVIGEAAWVLSVLADEALAAVNETIASSLEPLLDTLVDGGPEVQMQIVGLFTYVAEHHAERIKTVRPTLLSLLESDRAPTRAGAALTLGFVGERTDIDDLDGLRESDPDENVRRTAAKSVQMIRRRHES